MLVSARVADLGALSNARCGVLAASARPVRQATTTVEVQNQEGGCMLTGKDLRGPRAFD